MYHYYVRWKGDGPEHNSWMPFTNFDNIQIARNYWRQQRKQLFPPYVLDNVSNKEQDSIKNKGTLNKRKRLTTDGTMPAQIASSSQIQDLRRSKRNRLYVFYFFLPYFSTSERKWAQTTLISLSFTIWGFGNHAFCPSTFSRFWLSCLLPSCTFMKFCLLGHLSSRFWPIGLFPHFWLFQSQCTMRVGFVAFPRPSSLSSQPGLFSGQGVDEI